MISARDCRAKVRDVGRHHARQKSELERTVYRRRPQLTAEVVHDLVQRVTATLSIEIGPEQQQQPVARDTRRIRRRHRRQDSQTPTLICEVCGSAIVARNAKTAEGQKSKHRNDLAACDRRVTEM